MSEALPVLETRDHEAMSIVHRNMLWSGGVGVLPFPLFDLAAITGVQVKLVKELADFYGIPFRQDLAKSIVVGLIGSLTTGTLALIDLDPAEVNEYFRQQFEEGREKAEEQAAEEK